MSAETKKVLEMVHEGKLTTDDAEKLLERLGASPSEGATSDEIRAGRPLPPPRKLRFLRIVVDSPDRDQVNIRVPLAFMRTGMKFLAVLPPRITEKLAAKGIDLSALSELKDQNLVEALEELNLDVESSDGKKVRIFCE